MRNGLATTGRVITAAATIMIVVFLSFALGDDRVIKEFGIGLAAAVFLDAFVIRILLVPALMELAGERAWWLPAALERRLPKVALEHEEPSVAGEAATVGARLLDREEPRRDAAARHVRRRPGPGAVAAGAAAP